MQSVAEDYIDACYSKETYMRIYSHCLLPIASQEEWTKESEDLVEILPPLTEKRPGRPKEYKRKQQPGENNGKIILPIDDKRFGQMSRKGDAFRCSSCSQARHNKRNCPKNKVQGDALSKDKQLVAKKRKIDAVDMNVHVEACSSKRVKKLEVRRNVENWLDCSKGGAKLASTEHVVSSQPNTSGVKSSQAITNGFSLSQPVGNYSRHLGNACFATKPPGTKKT